MRPSSVIADAYSGTDSGSWATIALLDFMRGLVQQHGLSPHLDLIAHTMTAKRMMATETFSVGQSQLRSKESFSPYICMLSSLHLSLVVHMTPVGKTASIQS